MSDLDKVTIRKSDIKKRRCSACGTLTLHIGDSGNTCLQCVVDGAYSQENFKQYNRWLSLDGKPLASPRGYKP